jgi:transcriptional regulator with XRE-family HTH domain
MKLSSTLTDAVLLKELGRRLAEVRLARNLTQAALAAEAGVSTSTLARLESGAVGTQLSGLLRVCRTLGLLDRFELLFPEPLLGPMDELRSAKRVGNKPRARASTRSNKHTDQVTSWVWGDGS